ATLGRARRRAPAGAKVQAAIEQLTGRVLIIMGRGDHAREHYRRARRIAERRGDRITLVRTIRDAAELDANVEMAEDGLRLASTLGDPVEHAFAHWVLGRQHRGRLRFAEAMAHFTTALAQARQEGECYLESLVLASIGRSHHHAGELEPARARYEEA